jgi:template-activating factor I
MPGIKRASPGADDEKNPLANVELKDEDAQNLQDIQKEIQRVELVVGERSSV